MTSKSDYQGLPSTLCTGCGHDSITRHIISAYFLSKVSPYNVAKLSGIGCSSKTPSYFMSQSHGFNGLHGRMASLSVGVGVANRSLHLLGVSGDGDTASIGMGGFVHLIRKNLPVVYIIENNGVYGLTKGQFSATADAESISDRGHSNFLEAIDLCSMAIELGCSFVARSFSGDRHQLISLLQAAIRHRGTAIIDVVSPCVTYANNPQSTKSFDYIKSHKTPWCDLEFVDDEQEEINVDFEEGTSQAIELHDGTKLLLKKTDKTFDVNDPLYALKSLEESRQNREVLTGLFHLNTNTCSYQETIELSEQPLTTLVENDLRPDRSSFKKIMQDFR